MVRKVHEQTIERLTEVLELPNGGVRETDSLGGAQPIVREFRFELCRKQTLFGEAPVDQFWFDHASIYRQRNQAARNHDAIVDCFWTLCFRAQTIFNDDVQESYILAKLSPAARTNGARRVFEDAVLSRAGRLGQSKYDLIRSLDERLVQSRMQETDTAEFSKQTGVLLGPHEYPKETLNRYQEKAEELLGEGRRALEKLGQAGLKTPLGLWRRWMVVARRSGNELDKQVLDILSYECRAAIHRCYSAVWCELLPQLEHTYCLSSDSVRFHRLWHLDQCMPSNDVRARFHLFHGHVFGLHPGTGIFAQTRTGRELIGEALQEAPQGPEFRRLLHGLLIAMHDYSDRSATISDGRRWAKHTTHDGDYEAKRDTEID